MSEVCKHARVLATAKHWNSEEKKTQTPKNVQADISLISVHHMVNLKQKIQVAAVCPSGTPKRDNELLKLARTTLWRVGGQYSSARSFYISRP